MSNNENESSLANDPKTDPNTNWDDAYANAAHIKNSDAYILQWASQEEQFREGQIARSNPMASISYGEHERQLIDIIHPIYLAGHSTTLKSGSA